MSIITFYSYKGGVGRSLAVANVAVELARSGGKVLVIDWDLEAPGLEEYFEDFKIDSDGMGLLFLLQEQVSFENHVWHLTATDGSVSLDFLPSGRDEEDYYPTLERFDQEEFFANGGGDFLESLRDEWLEKYDYVLIDSRTGLSDAGGICTIQLPDIIVGMFTATRQSVRGVREVLQLARRSRQNLAYTRPQFSIIPIPCRLNADDAEELEHWMDEFSSTVGGLLQDWLPKTISTRQLLSWLRIEHAPVLVHGTKILDDDLSCQAANSYRCIADLIRSDLQDLWTLTEAGAVAEKAVAGADLLDDDADFDLDGDEDAQFDVGEELMLAVDEAALPDQPDFKYDFFISVPPGSLESRWVEEFFLPEFQQRYGARSGRWPEIFFDQRELSANLELNSYLLPVLEQSRCMMVFVTARASRSDWTNHEITTFLSFEDKRQIIPIRLSDTELPYQLHDVHAADFREFFVTGSADMYVNTEFWNAFSNTVDELASQIILDGGPNGDHFDQWHSQ